MGTLVGFLICKYQRKNCLGNVNILDKLLAMKLNETEWKCQFKIFSRLLENIKVYNYPSASTYAWWGVILQTIFHFGIRGYIVRNRNV